MSRIHRMWQKAFESEFLMLRAAGVSEDTAIELAERYATEMQDRYVDAKLKQRREECTPGLNRQTD